MIDQVNYNDVLISIGIITPIVVTLVTGIIYIYHKVYNKGHSAAIDSECSKRIEDGINELNKTLINHVANDERDFKNIKDLFNQEENQATILHTEIFKRLNSQDTALSKIDGVLSVIREHVLKKS